MALAFASSGGRGTGGSGTVTNVSSEDSSIGVTNPTTTPVLQLASLDVIAVNEPAAADVPLNGQKITGLADGVASSDAATVGQLPSGGVASVTAGDTSIVVGGTSSDPTIKTATLDVIAADHPPAAAVAMNSKKITGLADGSAAQDAAAFGQIPTTFPGQEIGYDQIVANVSVTSTTESAGTTVLSAAAHTFDGGLVLVEFFSPSIQVGITSGDFMNICLFEGATELTRLCGVEIPATSPNFTACAGYGAYRFSPAAGPHTYTVTAYIGGTTPAGGKVIAGPGGVATQAPAFLRFTRV